MKERVGFVGLGQMGAPIAANLLQAGYGLRVYNRTASKAEPLLAKGAQLASSPANSVEEGGLAFSMVSDDAAMLAMTEGADGILSRLGRGGVHVAMSTLSPALAARMEATHQEVGAHYVAAPVFGRPDAAAARRLWVVTAGDGGALARVRPLLEATSQGVFEVGTKPSAANVVKVSGNFLIASAMEAMAEAFTLGEKNGVPRTRMAEIMGETLFACPIYQGYGGAIAEHRYSPASFPLPLGLKDVDLALDAAARSRTPLPLGQLVQRRLVSALAHDRGALDWAALAIGVSEEAAAPVRPHTSEDRGE